MRRAALYVRVSTLNGQTTDNQERVLREVADRMGCKIVEIYRDKGISGAKGPIGRPAFDALCKAAARREFDIVMAWSVDRLGRSLQDLVACLTELHTLKIDLFLHQQGLDTTTPTGRAMFQMSGVFAEWERAIIRERIMAGIARARTTGKTKTGRPIGRPSIPATTERKIREALTKGNAGIRKIAARHGVGVGTVQRIKRELGA
jgi:DNA invertase Pin-like site-specific DNA recombinase